MNHFMQKYLTGKSVLEISYPDARFGDDFITRQDAGNVVHAGIDLGGDAVFGEYVQREYTSAPDCLFGKNLPPHPSLPGKFDTVLLNRCLEYSDDILLALDNAMAMLGSNGVLLIVGTDKRFGINHLRDTTSFREALAVREGGAGPRSYLLFDAAYNMSPNFDVPSYWLSSPIVGEPGESYGRSRELAQQAEAGRGFAVPYWLFTETSFLRFIRDVVKSGLVDIAFSDFRRVALYDDRFVAVLGHGGGISVEKRLRGIDDAIVRASDLSFKRNIESEERLKEVERLRAELDRVRGELARSEKEGASFIRAIKSTYPISAVRGYLRQNRKKRKREEAGGNGGQG